MSSNSQRKLPRPPPGPPNWTEGPQIPTPEQLLEVKKKGPIKRVIREEEVPVCPRCWRECVGRTISSVQPVQIATSACASRVVEARMQIETVWVCPVCPNTVGHLVRHLPGQHDQETHNPHGGGSGTDGHGGNAFDHLALSGKEDYLSAHGGHQWEQSLSKQERTAIDDYTWISNDAGYETVNRALRTGHYPGFDSGEIDRQVALMTGALMRGSAPADMTLLRTVGDDMFSSFAANVGRHFVDRGFVSTTINPAHMGGPIKETTMHIQFPKGGPGGYLKNIASTAMAAQMNEWLLPPNAKMHIDSVSTDPSGHNHVYLTYVGQHQWS